jgi:hypothetical protein
VQDQEQVVVTDHEQNQVITMILVIIQSMIITDK